MTLTILEQEKRRFGGGGDHEGDMKSLQKAERETGRWKEERGK